MKFSSTILLSAAFIAGVSANDNLLRGGRDLKGKPSDGACFTADLGDHGTVEVKVADGKIKIETKLTNLGEVFLGTQAAYHFHSGYLGNDLDYAVTGAAGTTALACDGAFTKGHYDPTLACGGASTAPLCSDVSPGTKCCDAKPAAGYCSTEPCEVGDLSGLYGKIPIVDDATDEEAEGDVYPKFLKDYLGDGDAAYDTWGSIVFHDTNGKRVLCGNLVAE